MVAVGMVATLEEFVLQVEKVESLYKYVGATSIKTAHA